MTVLVSGFVPSGCRSHRTRMAKVSGPPVICFGADRAFCRSSNVTTMLRGRRAAGKNLRAELHLLPLYWRIIHAQIQVDCYGRTSLGRDSMQVQISDGAFRRELRLLRRHEAHLGDPAL